MVRQIHLGNKIIHTNKALMILELTMEFLITGTIQTMIKVNLVKEVIILDLQSTILEQIMELQTAGHIYQMEV